jgi:hypothetical protein
MIDNRAYPDFRDSLRACHEMVEGAHTRLTPCAAFRPHDRDIKIGDMPRVNWEEGRS